MSYFISFFLLFSKPSFAYQLAPGVSIKEYNQAGIGINDTLYALATKMRHSPQHLELAFHPEFQQLQVGPLQAESRVRHGIVLSHRKVTTTINGPKDAMDWFHSLAKQYPQALNWTFKLVEIVSIDEQREVKAVFRYEVSSEMPSRQTERGEFLGHFKQFNNSYLLHAAELRRATASASQESGFVERAADAGISYYGQPDVRFLPPSDTLRFQTSRHSVGGVSVADVDGDGFDDVLMLGGGQAKLFINEHQGTFVEKTKAFGLDDISHANVGVFADLDNDGDQDLFLATFIGGNQLFRNDGSRFVDITSESGLGTEDTVSVAAVVDVNNDGLLDLYLGRFLDIRKEVPHMIHYTRNGQPNRLYINQGSLTFQDKSKEAGVDDVGLTLGIAAADIDQDGDQDLYLANDFGRNVFYQNQGDGTFKDIAKDNGTLAISGGMSASLGDYDGDGWLDIYVSSIRSNQRWFSHDLNIRSYVMNIVQSKRRNQLWSTFLDLKKHLGDQWDKVGQQELAGNYLLRNQGDGLFSDRSDASNTRMSGWYWGSGFVDIDNDGWLDIYAVNGWISGEDSHDL